MRSAGLGLSDEINSFCMAEELPVQMMSAQSLFYLRFQRAQINSSRDIDSSLHDAEIEFYPSSVGSRGNRAGDTLGIHVYSAH